MTIEEVIYDIFEIKQAVNDDTDLDELFILQKLNNYRSIFIQEDYAKTPIINPGWVQRTGVLNPEKINSADDPNISVSSITLGKVEIPPIITLPEDIGLYRISGSSGITSFDFVSFPELMLKIWSEYEILQNYGLASRLGNVLYIYPYSLEIQAYLIGENPMDFPVQESGIWRARTFSDDYPVDASIAQKAILEILIKDLNIRERTIEDIINDSQVQLKIMKNAQSGS